MASRLVTGEAGLRAALNNCDCAVLLLYASWCPFSMRFVPVFEKHATKPGAEFLSFDVEDKSARWNLFSLSIVPTVVCLMKGKLHQRLDGEAGRGLTEKQLVDFLEKAL
jgi:hypothetical protein